MRVPAGRPSQLFLLSVVLLGTVLRVSALDKPFYVDEIVTITVASQPLASMGSVMRQIDASPALYPVLLHGWLTLARTDAWVRGLSALFGILAVVVVYEIGRRRFGIGTALGAAFVAAIAPAHVHYAQYVRGYSLFTLLASLQLLLFLEWFARPQPLSRTRFGAFVLVTAACFYTHYLALLLLPVEGVFVLWHFRTRARVLRWTGAVCLALIVFLPGVPLLLHNVAFDRIRNQDRPLPPPVYRLIPDLVGELSLGQRPLGFSDASLRRTVLAGGAVLFPTLLVLGVRDGWRRDREATILLLAAAILPIALYVGSGRRLVAVRFFVPFMAGYLVLLGNGLAVIGTVWRTTVAGLLTLLCAVPLAHFYASFQWSYDHRAVAAAIAARWRSGDVLLFVHPYEALYYRWYLGPEAPMEGLVFTVLDDQGTYVIKPPPMDPESARPRVLEAAERYDRMWVIGQSIRSFASDPAAEERLFEWLDQRYEREDALRTGDTGDPQIRLYRSRSTDRGPQDRQPAGFDRRS